MPYTTIEVGLQRGQNGHQSTFSESESAFIARYVYTYEEFVFVTEASTVQQNDSDRTKNTDNKKKNKKIEQVNKE